MDEKINSGTLDGLSVFCDWLIEKGRMTAPSVEPLRSASKVIVTAVEPNNPGAVKIIDESFDFEDFMSRFETKAGHKYTPDSLNAYRRRFTRAIELYKQYLEVGAANFKAPAGRAPRRRAVASNGVVRTPVILPLDPATGTSSATAAVATPVDGLLDYPFPLSSGQLAHLHLPVRLEKDDAERMAVLIRALVYEPQKRIEAGVGEGE
jgi:hypothetical protein